MRSIILIAASLWAGCFSTRVETMSQPTTVHLRLTDTCHGDVVVDRHAGAGEYELVTVDGANADVIIPAMDGGYTERGGNVSNVSNPYDYHVLRFRLRDQILRELSRNEIRALPKDPDGRAVVPVPCPPKSLRS